MKKRLNVPFIKELDRLSLEEASKILAEKAYLHSMGSLNWSDMFSYKPLTSFSLARGVKELYVRFFVHGNCLRAVHEEDQTPVYEDSCVGLALQNMQTKTVYDIAFNCIGACSVVEKKSGIGNLLDHSQVQQIRRFTDMSRRPFCEVEGLFNWQVVVAIPFSLLGFDLTESDTMLTGNFYKRADKTALPHYLSWLPVKSQEKDFALSDSFGELAFESKL
ncbi:MAG: carbohydrate-binding family 9-like protein [Bacteroidales bacterium]